MIRNKKSGKEIYLNSQHTFGRNRHTANTHFPESDISQSHALISWKGNHWYLQDHSRNGTLVNGEYQNNTTIKLTQGNNIQFGEQETTLWEFIDATAPCSYLKSLQPPEEIIEINECLAFPNEELPEILIYPENGIWKFEKEGRPASLVHNQTYTINAREYVFVENKILEDTMDNGYVINNAYFQFVLSLDEEHIRLKIIIEHAEIDLGERVHNYMLLTLARKRLQDADQDLVRNDQGWMPMEDLIQDVSKEFGKEIDAYYLNLNIYRLRKLLMQTQPYGPLFSNIIERRQGELRFAHPYFQILKEEKCIGQVLAEAH